VGPWDRTAELSRTLRAFRLKPSVFLSHVYTPTFSAGAVPSSVRILASLVEGVTLLAVVDD
jgi:uncharacterized protein YbbC (DUF1343 family)